METVNAFDILIALIKACQDNYEEPCVSGPKGYDSTLGGIYYLLGQSVRHLWNKEGHKALSKEANKLWNDLKVDDSIFDYYYQKRVYYKNDIPVHVKGYTGAKSTPDWEEDLKFVKTGDNFKFRQVFHIEHIVPISIIIDELLKLDLSEEKEIVYKKMNTILNKIYVCYMTKDEDRKLNKVAKTNRSDNYIEVINNEYKKAGIEVVEWK